MESKKEPKQTKKSTTTKKTNTTKSKQTTKKSTKTIQNKSKELKKKSEKLSKEAKVKTEELNKKAQKEIKELSKEAKLKTDELAKEAKEVANDIKEKTEEILNDVEDNTNSFSKKEIDAGRGFALIAYILPFIPYLTEKKNKFVIYHARQGMDLLIITMAYYILTGLIVTIFRSQEFVDNVMVYSTPVWLTFIINLGYIFIIALAITGIIYVCRGKAKELPIINKIKIFK